MEGIWRRWLAVRGPSTAPTEFGQGLPVDAPLGPPDWLRAHAQAQMEGSSEETSAERYDRVKKWLGKHPPSGVDATVLRWERAFTRLRDCQKEYVVQQAVCCGDKTEPRVVPVGCNHRLCPLCSWHRSEVARVRVKVLCDNLAHPALITFTKPNLAEIHKADFKQFRGEIRAFFDQRAEAIRGGVYSIETTFNRYEQTWHMHAHSLVDLAAALPQSAGLKKSDRVDFYGKKVFPFVAQKWCMEFDWLQLTGGAAAWGTKPSSKQPKRPGAVKKWLAAWDAYNKSLAAWVAAKREHSTVWAKEWNPETKKMQLRADLSPEEAARYKELERWNAENTRVLDIRAVTDRERAAFEVLKYITKCAAFSDIPGAVEQFCNATRGARLIQTFGSWYGIDLEATRFDPLHMKDWGERECACGLNMWENAGTVGPGDVRMDITGQWRLKSPHHAHCLDNRPRIRGSDPNGETSYV